MITEWNLFQTEMVVGFPPQKCCICSDRWGGKENEAPGFPFFCVSGLYYSSYEFSTALYPTSTQMYIDYLKQGHLYHDGKVQGIHISVKFQRLRWTFEKYWGHIV